LNKTGLLIKQVNNTTLLYKPLSGAFFLRGEQSKFFDAYKAICGGKQVIFKFILLG
jgi:hypothetical protein